MYNPPERERANRHLGKGNAVGFFSRKPTRSEATIDLRDSPTIDLTDRASRPTWGLPTPCPECGDYGYLDRVDVINGVMFQHCPTCWAKWETLRSETASA